MNWSQKIAAYDILACHETAVDDETEALDVLDFALPLEQTLVHFIYRRFAAGK